MNSAHYRKLENMYHAAKVNEYFQPRLEVAHGKTMLTIPVREDFFHAAGAIHGSVYFKAMDDACFFAVNSLVDVFVLTVSFNLYLLGPVSTGEIVAHGVVTYESKSSWLAEATLVDGDGKTVARGSGSFVRSKISLTPEIGYR